MKLNGYTIEEVEDYYASLTSSERYAIDMRAAERDLHPLESAANRMYYMDKKAAEAESRAVSAREAREAAADMTITEETAKKVIRHLSRVNNKAKRADVRRICEGLGERVINPQTREATVYQLTELQGLRIIGKAY